ncbi:MAG: anthranilate phosphoribosyltransferase [Verrucomicrobia bacterium]|nr:MAG: anthranilate phosphoribosyltransferase [Verrucomicrobiota bacterium]
MTPQLIAQLAEGRELDPDAITEAVAGLVDPAGDPARKAAFLTALARKGETSAEIAGFARALRALSLPIPLDPETRSRDILDVCGTGGDRLNTFNISTTVALVCAAAGVTVAKHGNRAITSQSGSADVLEALGIPVEVDPATAAARLHDHGFAFLFAPRFHPAFQHIAPARRLCAEKGQPTLFNFLGPLLNPARPTVQLVGVSRPELTEPMARTLQQLGVRRAMVVSGEVPGPAHLDELSTLGENVIAEFYQDRALSTSRWSPSLLPLVPAGLADLAGGDRFVNATLVERLLAGEERGARRDAVLLNAGAALFVAGKAPTIADGWELAAATIDGGRATRKLADLRAAR